MENFVLGAIGGAIPGVFHKGGKNKDATEALQGAAHIRAAYEMNLSYEDHIKYMDELVGERGGYNFLNENGEFIGKSGDRTQQEAARDIMHQQIKLVHEIKNKLEKDGYNNPELLAELMGSDMNLFQEGVNALFVAQMYKDKLADENQQLSEKDRLDYQEKVAFAEKHANDVFSGRLYGEYLALQMAETDLLKDKKKFKDAPYGKLLGRRHVALAAKMNAEFQLRQKMFESLNDEEFIQYQKDRGRITELIDGIDAEPEEGKTKEQVQKEAFDEITKILTSNSNLGLTEENINSLKEKVQKNEKGILEDLMKSLSGASVEIDGEQSTVKDQVKKIIETLEEGEDSYKNYTEEEVLQELLNNDGKFIAKLDDDTAGEAFAVNLPDNVKQARAVYDAFVASNKQSLEGLPTQEGNMFMDMAYQQAQYENQKIDTNAKAAQEIKKIRKQHEKIKQKIEVLEAKEKSGELTPEQIVNLNELRAQQKAFDKFENAVNNTNIDEINEKYDEVIKLRQERDKTNKENINRLKEIDKRLKELQEELAPEPTISAQQEYENRIDSQIRGINILESIINNFKQTKSLIALATLIQTQLSKSLEVDAALKAIDDQVEADINQIIANDAELQTAFIALSQDGDIVENEDGLSENTLFYKLVEMGIKMDVNTVSDPDAEYGSRIEYVVTKENINEFLNNKKNEIRQEVSDKYDDQRNKIIEDNKVAERINEINLESSKAKLATIGKIIEKLSQTDIQKTLTEFNIKITADELLELLYVNKLVDNPDGTIGTETEAVLNGSLAALDLIFNNHEMLLENAEESYALLEELASKLSKDYLENGIETDDINNKSIGFGYVAYKIKEAFETLNKNNPTEKTFANVDAIVSEFNKAVENFDGTEEDFIESINDEIRLYKFLELQHGKNAIIDGEEVIVAYNSYNKRQVFFNAGDSLAFLSDGQLVYKRNIETYELSDRGFNVTINDNGNVSVIYTNADGVEVVEYHGKTSSNFTVETDEDGYVEIILDENGDEVNDPALIEAIQESFDSYQQLMVNEINKDAYNELIEAYINENGLETSRAFEDTVIPVPEKVKVLVEKMTELELHKKANTLSEEELIALEDEVNALKDEITEDDAIEAAVYITEVIYKLKDEIAAGEISFATIQEDGSIKINENIEAQFNLIEKYIDLSFKSNTDEDIQITVLELQEQLSNFRQKTIEVREAFNIKKNNEENNIESSESETNEPATKSKTRNNQYDYELRAERRRQSINNKRATIDEQIKDLKSRIQYDPYLINDPEAMAEAESELEELIKLKKNDTERSNEDFLNVVEQSQEGRKLIDEVEQLRESIRENNQKFTEAINEKKKEIDDIESSLSPDEKAKIVKDNIEALNLYYMLNKLEMSKVIAFGVMIQDAMGENFGESILELERKIETQRLTDVENAYRMIKQALLNIEDLEKALKINDTVKANFNQFQKAFNAILPEGDVANFKEGRLTSNEKQYYMNALHAIKMRIFGIAAKLSQYETLRDKNIEQIEREYNAIENRIVNAVATALGITFEDEDDIREIQAKIKELVANNPDILYDNAKYEIRRDGKIPELYKDGKPTGDKYPLYRIKKGKKKKVKVFREEIRAIFAALRKDGKISNDNLFVDEIGLFSDVENSFTKALFETELILNGENNNGQISTFAKTLAKQIVMQTLFLDQQSFYEQLNNTTKNGKHGLSIEQDIVLKQIDAWLDMNENLNEKQKKDIGLAFALLDDYSFVVNRNPYLSNVLFVDGVAGGGKSFVLKHAAENMLRKMFKNGEAAKIVLSAQSQQLLDSLTEDIQSHLDNIEEFKGKTYEIESVLSSEILDENSELKKEYDGVSIILDEATLLTNEEIQSVMNSNNTVLLSGDTGQMHNLAEIQSKPFTTVNKTWRITQSNRTGLEDSVNLQDLYREYQHFSKTKIRVTPFKTSYFDNGTERRGVRAHDNNEDMYDTLRTAVNNNKGNSIVLIVATDDDLNNVPQDIKDLSASNDLFDIKTLSEGDSSVQGLTYDEIFIAKLPNSVNVSTTLGTEQTIKINGTDGDVDFEILNKMMLTALTRAKNYVSYVAYDGIKVQDSQKVEDINEISNGTVDNAKMKNDALRRYADKLGIEFNPEEDVEEDVEEVETEDTEEDTAEGQDAKDKKKAKSKKKNENKKDQDLDKTKHKVKVGDRVTVKNNKGIFEITKISFKNGVYLATLKPVKNNNIDKEITASLRFITKAKGADNSNNVKEIPISYASTIGDNAGKPNAKMMQLAIHKALSIMRFYHQNSFEHKVFITENTVGYKYGDKNTSVTADKNRLLFDVYMKINPVDYDLFYQTVVDELMKLRKANEKTIKNDVKKFFSNPNGIYLGSNYINTTQVKALKGSYKTIYDALRTNGKPNGNTVKTNIDVFPKMSLQKVKGVPNATLLEISKQNSFPLNNTDNVTFIQLEGTTASDTIAVFSKDKKVISEVIDVLQDPDYVFGGVDYMQIGAVQVLVVGGKTVKGNFESIFKAFQNNSNDLFGNIGKDSIELRQKLHFIKFNFSNIQRILENSEADLTPEVKKQLSKHANAFEMLLNHDNAKDVDFLQKGNGDSAAFIDVLFNYLQNYHGNESYYYPTVKTTKKTSIVNGVTVADVTVNGSQFNFYPFYMDLENNSEVIEVTPEPQQQNNDNKAKQKTKRKKAGKKKRDNQGNPDPDTSKNTGTRGKKRKTNKTTEPTVNNNQTEIPVNEDENNIPFNVAENYQDESGESIPLDTLFEDGMSESEVYSMMSDVFGVDFTLAVIDAVDDEGDGLFVTVQRLNEKFNGDKQGLGIEFNDMTREKAMTILGVMSGGSVPLQLGTQNGKVHRYTPIHEMVHFVVDHLLTPDSRRNLLEIAHKSGDFTATFEEMYATEEGRSDLNEHLAKVSEEYIMNKRKPKSLWEKIIQAFVDLVRDIKAFFSEKVRNENELYTFYNQINDGHFKDAAQEYLNGNRFYSEDGNTVRYNQKSTNLKPAFKAFGTDAYTKLASKMFGDMLFDSSFFNSLLTDNNARGIYMQNNLKYGLIETQNKLYQILLKHVVSSMRQLGLNVTDNGTEFIFEENGVEPYSIGKTYSIANGKTLVKSAEELIINEKLYKKGKYEYRSLDDVLDEKNNSQWISKLFSVRNDVIGKNMFEVYTAYAAIKSFDIFKGLAQMQLGSIDVEDVLTNNKNENYVIYQDSIDAKESGEVNPMDKASDIIKGLIRSTELNYKSRFNKKVDEVLVHTIIVHFGNLGRHITAEEKQKGMSELDVMGERMLEFLESRYLNKDMYAAMLHKRDNTLPRDFDEMPQDVKDGFYMLQDEAYYNNVKALYDRFFNKDIMSFNGLKEVHKLNVLALQQRKMADETTNPKKKKAITKNAVRLETEAKELYNQIIDNSNGLGRSSNYTVKDEYGGINRLTEYRTREVKNQRSKVKTPYKPVSDDKINKHMEFMNNKGVVLNNEFEAFADMVERQHKYNQSVLSALMKLGIGHFNNKDVQLKVTKGRYGVYFNPVYRQHNIDANAGSILADNIKNEFTDNETILQEKLFDRFVLGKHYYESKQKLKEKNPIIVKYESGEFNIYYEENGRSYTIATVSNRGFRFINNEDITFNKQQMVKQAMLNFGINLNSRQIKNLIQVKSNKNGIVFNKQRGLGNQQSFLNSFAVLTLSAYAAAIDGNEKYTEAYDLLNNIFGSNKFSFYKKENSHNLINRDSNDTQDIVETEQNEFIFPTMFTNEINLIGKSATMSGSRSASASYSAERKKVFDRQVANQLEHLFPINENNKKTNEKLISIYTDLIDELIAANDDYEITEIIENHNINYEIDEDTGQIIIDILNPLVAKDQGKIINRYSKGGVVINKKQGKNFDKLNIIDQMDYILELNVRAIMDGQDYFVAMDENEGDRKVQDLSQVNLNIVGTVNSNGIFIVNNTEETQDLKGKLDLSNEKAIVLDYANIYELIYRKMEINRFAQIHSINRLIEAFPELQYNKISVTDTDFYNVFQIMEEIQEALMQINSQVGTFSDLLKGKNLYLNKDIIIDKYGGFVSLGHDANFNINIADKTIYNVQRFHDFLRLTNRVKKGKEGHLAKIQKFINNENGVTFSFDRSKKGMPMSYAERQERGYKNVIGFILKNGYNYNPIKGVNKQSQLNDYYRALVMDYMADLKINQTEAEIKAESLLLYLTTKANNLDKDQKKRTLDVSEIKFLNNLIEDYAESEQSSYDTNLHVKQRVVDMMFEKQLTDFSKNLYNSRYRIPTKYKVGDVPIVKSKNSQNNLYVGVYLAHHFYTEFMMDAIAGTYSSFQNIQDRNKRLSVLRSPYLPIDTSNQFGVDAVTQTYVVVDNKVTANYSNKYDSTLDEVKQQDGLAFTTLVHRYLLHNSHGQQVGANSLVGSMKDVQFGMNFRDGTISVRKRSVDTITDEMLEYSPDMIKYHRAMLNPSNKSSGSLFHVLEDFMKQGMTFDQASERTAMVYARARNAEQAAIEYNERNLNKIEVPVNPYELVGYVEFLSSKKDSTQKNVLDESDFSSDNYSSIASNYYNYTNEHDHRQGGLQLEPYKDTDNSAETKPSQIMSFVLGSADIETSKNIQRLISEIGDAELINMLGEYDDIRTLKYTDGEAYRDNLINFVRKLMISSLANSTENTNMMDMLKNRNIAIDFPAIEAKAIQYIASTLTKRAIKFKMPGMRLNESKINAELYDWNGLVWSKKELLRFRKQADNVQQYEIDQALSQGPRNLKEFKYILSGKKKIEIDSIESDVFELIANKLNLPNNKAKELESIVKRYKSLQNIVENDFEFKKKFIQDSGIAALGLSNAQINKKLLPLIQQALYKHARVKHERKQDALIASKGEALAPAHQFGKYNIPRSYTLNEIMTIKSNGKLVNAATFLQEYDNNPDAAIEKFFGKKPTGVSISKSNRLLKHYYTVNKRNGVDNLVEASINQYIDALKGIYKSTNEVLSVRTPSTNSSSGSYMKIVGFVHNSGNNLYTSPKRMLLDGHDNDIDQATLYFLIEGVTDELTKKKQELVSNLFSYFKNPLNDSFTMQSIDLSRIINNAEEKVEEINDTLHYGDLFTTLYNKSTAIDGKVVGPFAQYIKVFNNLSASVKTLLQEKYNKLSHAEQSEIDFTMLSDLSNEEKFAMIVSTLGNFGNAATDNSKHNALGALGISIKNAYVVGAMIMNPTKVIDFVNARNRAALGEEAIPITNLTDAIHEVLSMEAHQDLIRDMEFYSSMRVNKPNRFYQAIVQRMESLSQKQEENENKLAELEKKIEKQRNKFVKITGSDEYYYEKNKAAKINKSLIADSTQLYDALRNMGLDFKIDYIYDIKRKKNNIIEFPALDKWVEEQMPRVTAANRVDAFNKIINEIKKASSEIHNNNDLLKEYRKTAGKLHQASKAYDRISRFSESYKSDLFFLAEMAVASNAYKNALSVLDLDQGLPVRQHEMLDQIMEIEHLVGLPFNEYSMSENKKGLTSLMDLYEEYQRFMANPKNNFKDFFKDFENKNSLKKRIKFSNNLFTNRTADKNNKKMGWRVNPIEHDGQELVYDQEVHKVLNIIPMLFSRPDVMNHLRSLHTMNAIVNDAFFSNNETHRSFLERLRKEHGYDKLYPDQLYTLKEQINFFYIDKFLKRDDNGAKKGSHWKRVFANVALVENGRSIDLSTAPGRQAFMREFPIYFMEQINELRKSNPNRYADNAFLNNIHISSNQNIKFLEFSNSYNIDDNMMAILKSSFMELPYMLQQQLEYYQLVKNGFDYRAGGFANIIGQELQIRYSKFIKTIEDESVEGKHEAELNNEFLDYLRANTKLGILRYDTEDGIPLSPEKMVTININGRKVKMHRNITPVQLEEDDINEYIKHTFYVYPNIGLPYDGNRNNVVTIMAPIIEEKENEQIEGTVKVNKTAFDTHPVANVSNDKHLEHVKEYYDMIGNPNKEPKVFSITFAKPVQFKPGHTLRFADGFVGKVVNSVGKVLEYSLLPHIQQHSVKYLTRLEDFQYDKIIAGKKSEKIVNKMVDAIKTMFPKVKISYKTIRQMYDDGEIDTKSYYNHSGDVSFIYNGVLHINRSRISPETLMEEFGHIWGAIIKTDNKELFYDFVNSFSNTELSYQVTDRYGYIEGSEEWADEIFAQAIRVRYASRVFGPLPIKLDKTKNIVKQIKQNNKSYSDVWDAVSSTANVIFSNLSEQYNERFNSYNEKPSFGVNENTTIGEFTDKIIDHLLNTMINERVVADPDLETDTTASTKFLKKVFGKDKFISAKDFTQAKYQNLNGTNADLNKLFQQDFGENVSLETDLRYLRGDIIAGLQKQKRNKDLDKLSYKDFTTGKIMFYDKSKNIEQLVDTVILPKIIESYNNSSESIISFLNKTKEMDLFDAAIRSIRKYYANTDDVIKVQKVEDDARRLVEIMEFNPLTDKAFSSLDDLSHLGIKIPKEFRDKDVIIIAHGDSAYSIVNVSPFKLSKNGHSTKSILNEIIFDENGKLLEDYVNDADFKGMNVQLTQKNKDIRSVQNTLLAMAIKKNNPKAKMKGMLVVNNGVALSKNGRGFTSHSTNIESMLEAVNSIFTIPVIYEAMSNSIKKLIDNKELFDADSYGQNYLASTRHLFNTYIELEYFENEIEKELFQNILDSINLDGKPANDSDFRLMALLQIRIEYLKNLYINNPSLLETNTEYININRTYTYLNNERKAVGNNIESINTIDKWLRQPNQYKNEFLKYLERQVAITNKKIERYVYDHNKVHNRKVEALMKEKGINRVLTLFDKSDDIFGRLYKTIEGVDKEGNPIVFNANEIHWEADISYNGEKINDNYQLFIDWVEGRISEDDVEIDNMPEDVFEMIRDGRLSKTELLYGRWVMDVLEKNFIDSYKYMSRLNGTEEQRWKEAKEKLSERWKKGMLPVMPKKLSQNIADLVGKKSDRDNNVIFKAIVRSVAKFDTVFDDVYEEQQEQSAISNPFFAQFDRYGAGELGGEKRSRLIGVKKSNVNGHITYNYYSGDGKTNNSNMTTNIQDVLNYSVLASKRAIEMNKRLVPIYGHLKALVTFEGISKNRRKAAKDIMDMAENFYNRNVLGEVQEVAGYFKIGNKKLDPNKSIIASVTYSGLSLLGFSPRIATRSALGVGFEMLTKAVGNDIVGNRFFGLKEMQSAVKELVTNRKLVSALNYEVMHLTNMDERALIRHRENIASANHAIQQDLAHILNFYGEHGARLLGMVAQMIKEGSYGAYSLDGNKLVYDETKDKRMYDAKGNITKFGQQLKNAIVKDFKLEGGSIWLKQKELGDKLLYGHSWRQAESLKVQADMFYSQGMTADTKSMLANTVLGVPLLQFKSFLVNKYSMWTQGSRKSGKLGFYKETENSELAEWEEMELRGIIHIYNDSIKRLMKTKSLSETWNSLSEMDKSMFIWGMGDIALLAGFAILTLLLTMGDDDEGNPKELNALQTLVYSKIIREAVNEKKANVFFPVELYKAMQDPIVADNLFATPIEAFVQLTDPFTVEDNLKNASRTLFKAIPGGANIRDMIPFAEEYLENIEDK